MKWDAVMPEYDKERRQPERSPLRKRRRHKSEWPEFEHRDRR